MAITVDTILDWFAQQVESKSPIAPELWLDGAMKCVALLGAEQDALYEMQGMLAIFRAELIASGDTAASAKIKTEANPMYTQMKKLEAKIERVYETVRLAKIRARMGQEEYKSQ
jgi:hypothetical protein